MPAAFSNSATARIRFDYHNGIGGTTGSRPKISIDNVAVTGSLMLPAKAGPTANESRATALAQAGRTRLEILDLGGCRVWANEVELATSVHE